MLIYKSNQMSSQRKMEKIRLSEYVPGGCGREKSVQYPIEINIPSLPPTDLFSSSVCRVKYEIQVCISDRNKFQISQMAPKTHQLECLKWKSLTKLTVHLRLNIARESHSVFEFVKGFLTHTNS